ncbi:MAG: hypothetical protein J7K13_00820 [Thermoplasmata archaeon]|nr:hypothetical protein [Thermoplasmata archaeon]
MKRIWKNKEAVSSPIEMVVAAGVLLITLSFFFYAIQGFFVSYEKTFDPAISTDIVYQAAEALIKDPGEGKGGSSSWEEDPANITALGFGKPASMEWYVDVSGGGSSFSLNTWSNYGQTSPGGWTEIGEVEIIRWIYIPGVGWAPMIETLGLMGYIPPTYSWWGGGSGSMQYTGYEDIKLVEIKETENYPYAVVSREKIEALKNNSLQGEAGYEKVKEALGIDPRYDFNITVTNSSGTIVSYGKSYEHANVITSLSRSILIIKKPDVESVASVMAANQPKPKIAELGKLTIYIFI